MSTEDTKYLDERFNSLTTLMNAQFGHVHERLDKINGRLGKHDDAITDINLGRQQSRDWVATRETSCPQLPRIIDLETKDKIGMSLKSFVIGSMVLICTVIGAVYSTTKIVESHQAKIIQSEIKAELPKLIQK